MKTISVIYGDGIGPEVMGATVRIIKETGAPLEYEPVDAGVAALEKWGEVLPEATLESIRRNKVALKGPLTTPVGKGFRSVNVALRKEFDLYANVRPAKNIPGVRTRYENVDLITVRENTEGMYTGIEHTVGDDVAEAIRVITKKCTQRVVRYAFELARREGRKKVTVLHKANIMKLTDGLFTRVAYDVAKDFPDILCENLIIDAACMKLVTEPEKFDVIVTSNLFGDIVSDLCSGLIGGLGLTCGSNIGENAAIFEAVHGSAPDIAGKNIANPTACLMAAVEMLKHLDMEKEAIAIDNAVKKVFAEGKHLTRDVGGCASTEEFANRVVDFLQ